jgi:hypothetical protein
VQGLDIPTAQIMLYLANLQPKWPKLPTYHTLFFEGKGLKKSIYTGNPWAGRERVKKNGTPNSQTTTLYVLLNLFGSLLGRFLEQEKNIRVPKSKKIKN